MLTNIIVANVFVGLIGAVGAYGVVSFFMSGRSKLMYMVSFAAGALVAVSFFDLLPEAIEVQGNLMTTMGYFVAGFVFFLLIEKSLLYYHCHDTDCQSHASSKLIIFGDSVHNFLDGIAIAASFLAGPGVGVFTTLAIIIHEIPQEVGDYGVLIHNGYTKKKALMYNLLSALAAVAGGVLAFYALNKLAVYVPYVLAITAGGFVYIATVDILPKVHHDGDTRMKISMQSMVFIFGILALWVLGKYVGE